MPLIFTFVQKFYGPVIAHHSSKRGFTIRVDDCRIGYIETYLGRDHRDFFENLGVAADGVAGVDLLIGEASYIGRGLGPIIIRRFTSTVAFASPETVKAIAGPDIRNRRSIAAFERVGYRRLHEVQVLGDAAPATVMEITRASLRP